MLREDAGGFRGFVAFRVDRSDESEDVNHIAFVLCGYSQLPKSVRIDVVRKRLSELGYGRCDPSRARRVGMLLGQGESLRLARSCGLWVGRAIRDCRKGGVAANRRSTTNFTLQ